MTGLACALLLSSLPCGLKSARARTLDRQALWLAFTGAAGFGCIDVALLAGRWS